MPLTNLFKTPETPEVQSHASADAGDMVTVRGEVDPLVVEATGVRSSLVSEACERVEDNVRRYGIDDAPPIQFASGNSLMSRSDVYPYQTYQDRDGERQQHMAADARNQISDVHQVSPDTTDSLFDNLLERERVRYALVDEQGILVQEEPAYANYANRADEQPSAPLGPNAGDAQRFFHEVGLQDRPTATPVVSAPETKGDTAPWEDVITGTTIPEGPPPIVQIANELDAEAAHVATTEEQARQARLASIRAKLDGVYDDYELAA